MFHFNCLRGIRFSFTTARNICHNIAANNNLVNFGTNGCDIQGVEEVQDLVRDNLFVYDEFITLHEEDFLYNELRTSLETQKYQYDHWDNVSWISFFSGD